MSDIFDERSRETLDRLTSHGADLPQVVSTLTEKQDVPPKTFGNWTRIAFTNGGGDYAIWFFGGPSEEMLLLTFDHESHLNFYDSDLDAQLRLYEGLPESMGGLVTGHDDDDAWLTMPAGDTRVVACSGVFSPNLSPGPEWEATTGTRQVIESVGAKMRDTGLAWLMRYIGI